MENAKKQIEKEIAKLQKKHDAIMKKFYKTKDEENTWGDGRLWERADNVEIVQKLLIGAIRLIEKYEKRSSQLKVWK